MGTTPPSARDIDEWMQASGATKLLLGQSFIPTKGFHVSAVVVGYTTNGGIPQFSILTGDPTKDGLVAKQLYGLRNEFGEVTVRAYDYEEPLPQISPQVMAAGDNIQARVGDMSNWATNTRS
jgi:hypothetical protein